MRRADRRQFHYIYKITRFDGKYYIGFHSTDDLDDGYFGSGKRIRNSINYHGREKHSKEILEFLLDRESLKKREAQIVNEECLRDPLCMNLKLGGEGGWDHIKNQKDIAPLGGAAFLKRLRNDESLRKQHALVVGENLRQAHADGKIRYDTFLGRKHSEETKKKISTVMSDKYSGCNHSQYGMMWITDGIMNKKIRKDDMIPEGFRKGRIC